MSRGKPIKLTSAKIEAMEAGEEMWDAIIPGLHIRARARHKSFHLAYTTISEIRRCPMLGRYGVEIKSLEHVREIAQAWVIRIAKGEDPSQDKEAAQHVITPPTLKDLKVRWEAEIKIAKERRGAEDAKISQNDLDDLQLIKKKKTTLADLASRTIVDYEYRWTVLIDHFKEDKLLSAITDEEVEKLHTKLTEKVKDTKMGFTRGGHVTANRTLTFLCTVMNLAKEWKMLEASRLSPSHTVSHYIERGRERFMTQEEMSRFIKVATAWMAPKEKPTTFDITNKRIARLASLCLVCGTRSGEIKTSRLSWINWDTNTLKVPKAKGDTWKTIPLGDIALSILNEIYSEWLTAGAKPEQDWIIPGDDPKTHFKGTKRAWVKFLKKAEIPHTGKKTKLTMHDLRHTFITRMVNSGSGSEDQAGKIAGHKNRETTAGYSHLMIEPARIAINKTYEDFGKILNVNNNDAANGQ